MEKKEQLGQCGREGKVSLMESAITFYQYNGLRHLCATTSTHTGGGDVFVQFFLLVLPLQPDDGAIRRGPRIIQTSLSPKNETVIDEDTRYSGW